MTKSLFGTYLCCLLLIVAVGPRPLQTAESLIDLSNRAEMSKRRPILIAHRGGIVQDDSPECSLAAIRLAAQAGYAMVELDIQRSRDGVPVVFHDSTMNKACGVDGRIADYTSIELTKIHYLDSNQKIVKLDTALSFCHELRLGLMLDLKAGRDDQAFLSTIEKMIMDRSLSKATVSISSSPTARQVLRHVMFSPTNAQMARFRKGEDVDLRGTFWFGLPHRLPSDDVARLQKSGALVFPAINTFRYPADQHMEMARTDMNRLVSAGVDGFQIDSVYSNLLPKK